MGRIPERSSPRKEGAKAPPQRFADVGTILDSINDGVFTVDADFRITSFNRAAETITGVSMRQAIGRRCWEVFRADICEGQCALKQTIATSRPVVNKPIRILTSAGRGVPISVSTALLRDGRGEVMGGGETFRDLSLVEELRREVEGRHTFHDMISADHRMREIFRLLPLIAQSGSTVLVTGESGTGKELMARAIHDLSPRRRAPLVAVNCSALPDALLESELFGYVAGAFTDARRDRQGRLEAAQGGSLFLDEIGDLSPAVQVRLLRVLQEKTFERLGSNQTLRADVRFIAATHRDLRREVEAGRFREDLFYRLNVVQVAIPPLRERREDVPLLVRHFVARLNLLHGRAVQEPDAEAMECLMKHDWPGNIRELENLIERAVITSPEGNLQIEIPALSGFLPDQTLSLQELERAYILKVLEKSNWKVEGQGGAAFHLGLNPSTLRFRMKKLHIDRPPSR